MNNLKYILCCTAACLVVGCTSNGGFKSDISGFTIFEGSSYSAPTCERAIKYQSKKVSFGGVEVNADFLGGNVVKLGSFSSDPQKIREAVSLIKASDLSQYNSCQSLNRWYSLLQEADKEERKDIREKMFALDEKYQSQNGALLCFLGVVETGGALDECKNQ